MTRMKPRLDGSIPEVVQSPQVLDVRFMPNGGIDVYLRDRETGEEWVAVEVGRWKYPWKHSEP